jgi:hypothetical protein
MVLQEHGGVTNRKRFVSVRGGSALPPRSIITAEKEIDLDKIYDQKNNPNPLKPLGLWYAIGDSWYKHWYRNHLEMKNLPKNLNIFKLSIHKNSFTTDVKNPDPNKILRIKTNDDVKLFTKLYRMKPYKKLSLLDNKENVYFDYNIIDWQKVAKKFGGIEFNPYIHQVIDPIINGKIKIIMIWYTTVDVPSGCIWNLKNIVKNIEKMSRRELSANLKNIKN